MTELLRTFGIGKSFGRTVALEDVSIAVRQGEVVCLLGESNAGKTTLLRCLNLLEHVDRGAIDYGGYRVIEADAAMNGNGATNGARKKSGHGRPGRHDNGSSSRSRAARRPRLCVNEDHYRRKFGVVSPLTGLMPRRTVLQNVVDGPVHVLRQKRAEAEPLAREILNAVGLAGCESRPARHLDTARQRQVALARALAMKPEILLVDEITADLDPPQAARLLQILREVREVHNASMLMVTHHLGFVRDVADRAFFMHAGRIVEAGRPGLILETPESDELRSFLQSVRATAA